jgi:diacylglycerol O-acyltransferase
MAPVSVRTQGERGALGNRVSAWTVELPVAEQDPLIRLDTVRRATAELKASRSAAGGELFTQAAEWTGAAPLTLAARFLHYGTPVNMVITNVPGPRDPLYLLESPLLALHPHLPLVGTMGVGIALLSYGDTLSWGFSGDWELVPDLHELVLATERSFDDLCDAARSEAHP